MDNDRNREPESKESGPRDLLASTRALLGGQDDPDRDELTGRPEMTAKSLDHSPPEKDRPLRLASLDEDLSTRDRYTLTRVQGKGGLGQVWLALDRQLNRQVALKEVRPDREPDADTIDRLIQEAQITGQLEHPNIVPVYELSRQGTPFYTMRFLRGTTFREVIQEYHKLRRERSASPLALRRLLDAFVGICNAVAYAGSKGIVHRDLKPDNVMLGSFGEVLVLDWGLARTVDPSDDHADEAATHAKPQGREIAVTADAVATLDGEVLGTLLYMAPEQAAGRLEQIDHRTDVFGLGGVLFSILTGQPPHGAAGGRKSFKETRAVLEQISSGPPPEPAAIDASVPSALNAICCKALAKDRADRYQTATELADDVRRWLADEPVSVYEESVLERTSRWMRNHRTWTQAIGVILLCVALISITAAFLVNGARRVAVDAKNETERAWTAEKLARVAERKAKDEAMHRFQQSRDTVDQYLTNMATVLQYYPGARALRAKLLERAAHDYERFASQQADDPEIRAATARAWGRLGEVRQLLGQYDEAEQAFVKAESLMRELDAAAQSAQNQMERAYCLARLGDLYRKLQQYDTAAESYSTAAVLAARNPDVPGYRQLQPRIRMKRAALSQKTEDFDTAVALLEHAIAEFEILAGRPSDPQHSQYLHGLAEARAQLGKVQVGRGRNQLAATIIEQAVLAFERLTVEDPDSVPFLEGLAFSRINFANALRVLGREEEMKFVLLQAIRDSNLLLQTMPDVPVFRENRAVARTGYGAALHEEGRNAEAKEVLEQAFIEFKELWESNHPLSQYYERLVETAAVRAQTLRDLNEDDEAEIALTGAITAYEQDIIPHQPDLAGYHRGLALARRELGRLYYKLADYAAARQELDATVEAFTKALELDPDDPYAQDGLASAHEYLGDLEQNLGESDQAQQSYSAALALRERLPQNPEYRFRLASLLLKMNQPDTTQRVTRLAHELSDEYPDSGRYLTLLGAAYYVSDHAEKCIEILQQADDRQMPENSAHDFWLALALADRGAPGDDAKAEMALTRAIQRMEQYAPGDVQLIELRRRAETRLESGTKDAAKSSNK